MEACIVGIVLQLNTALLNVVLTKCINMVFNVTMNANQTDAEIISNLGGPAKVAELLRLDKQGGVQRVQNWIARGIPSRVKVDRPDLFMPELTAQAQQPAEQGATQCP